VRKKPPSFILIFGIIAALAVFVGLNQYLSLDPEADMAQQAAKEQAAQIQAAKAKAPEKAKPKSKTLAIRGDKTSNMIVLDTPKGTMKIKLFEDEMPISVANFKELIEKKFYDGLIFHRVEDWVIQGGDPLGTGTGGSDKTIKLEINKKHGFDKAGMVGMARSNDRDSATSQFFVVTKSSSFLNDGYACFGEVVEGLDVIKKIQKGDKMTEIYFAKPEPAKPAESAKP